MKKQEFVDLCNTAIEALKQQGEPAINSKGNCGYSTSVGNCIVGHMMPNDETRITADKFEIAEGTPGSGIRDLSAYGFEWAQQFGSVQIDVLSDLQMLHDESETPEGLAENLPEMRSTVTRYEEAA